MFINSTLIIKHKKEKFRSTASSRDGKYIMFFKYIQLSLKPSASHGSAGITSDFRLKKWILLEFKAESWFRLLRKTSSLSMKTWQQQQRRTVITTADSTWADNAQKTSTPPFLLPLLTLTSADSGKTIFRHPHMHHEGHDASVWFSLSWERSSWSKNVCVYFQVGLNHSWDESRSSRSLQLPELIPVSSCPSQQQMFVLQMLIFTHRFCIFSHMCV